jgi:hypothetical protein
MMAVQPSVVTRTKPEYNNAVGTGVTITESEQELTPTKLSSCLIRHPRNYADYCR